MNTYYTLKVCHVEVYEWTDGGQGDHVCSKDGFTLGSFDTVDCCKAYLEDFFGDEPDYGAYEGDNFLSCSRIEDVDAYPSYNSDERQFIADYMVMIEKVSHVSWGGVDPIQDSDNNTFIIRNKCRGYGVLASYPTREQAESNLWRYAMHGGDLVVEIARTKVPALDVNGKFIYNEGGTA